jgi:hypothetical protein
MEEDEDDLYAENGTTETKHVDTIRDNQEDVDVDDAEDDEEEDEDDSSDSVNIHNSILVANCR